MSDRTQMVGDLAKALSQKLHEDIDRQLAVARFALDGAAVSAVHALALQTVIEIWLGSVVVGRRRDLSPGQAFDIFLTEMHGRVLGARGRVVQAVERAEAGL